MIKAIPTKYKNYLFRSRLEARWAVFFDSLGIRYEYELEGFDLGSGIWYLPDFYLPEWNVWIETKPVLPIEDFIKTEDGESLLLVVKDGKATNTSRELIKIHALQKFWNESKGDKKKHYIFYNPPYLPTIEVKDGKWRLVDGCLGFSPFNLGGCMILDACAFAMVDGGGALDIWPYYMDKKYLSKEEIERNNNSASLFANPILPDNFMARLYLGKGIQYNTDNLMSAYNKARQARF